MLTGDKVMLGPLVQTDAQPLFLWMNDRVIAESNGVWRPTDAMDFTTWFQNVGKDQGKVIFAIRKPGEGRLVGYLSILGIHHIFRSAEMGVTIGASGERGKGMGRDAMRLGMRYCWESLGLERITLRIFGDNPAAIRCYQGAGFVLEGVLRRAAYLNGRRVDVTLMGALRQD